MDKEYTETNIHNGKKNITTTSHIPDQCVMASNHKNSEKSHLKILKADKHYLINKDDISSNAGASSCNMSQWRVVAVIISWLSIVATLAIGISEFVVAKREDSSAAFGLAFDAILDVLTSAVVLWRYYRSNETFSQVKEHLSCLVLGILFLVSAIGIAAKAIFSLLDGDTLNMSESGLYFLLTVTSVAAGICSFLFVVKIFIAKKLSSWTMLSDGIHAYLWILPTNFHIFYLNLNYPTLAPALNSLMGGIIALSMIITVRITKSNPNLWFLDPVVGLSVSLFLVLYGLWLLTKHIPKLRATVSYQQSK